MFMVLSPVFIVTITKGVSTGPGGKSLRRAWRLYLGLGLVLLGLSLIPARAEAFTANKVWFEARPSGVYRVHVNYTVPELREFREAYVEFKKRSEAEAFYWDAVRGADVYLDNPAQRRFVNQTMEARPW